VVTVVLLLVVVATVAGVIVVVAAVAALRAVVGAAAGTPAERAHCEILSSRGNDLRGAVAWDISVDHISVITRSA